jgi:hypothetical protein
MTTTITRTLRDMDDVRAVNRDAGSHWFDPDTLRFFGSRIGDTLYGRRFFTSSEYASFDRRGRKYTVRVVLPDGSIDDAGGFLALNSSAAARRLAERLAAACRAGRLEVRHDPYNAGDEPNRRHYAWRVYVTPEHGEPVEIGTRDTWTKAHALKRWLRDAYRD